MQKLLRVTVIIIIVAVLLIIPGIFIVRSILKQSVPSYEGNIDAAGLKGETTIWFDSLGVPYIEAQDETDAAYALGYLHAQERLFQMELGRRAGMGRLSEVIGEKTLRFDQLFRTVGIERTAKEILSKTPDETRNMLQAYAEGVNTYLRLNKNRLPVEFDILGYTPEEWQPLHSIIMMRMMAWELNIAWWQDISLTRVVEKAGDLKRNNVIPSFPDDAPLVSSLNIKSTKDHDFAFFDIVKDYREFAGIQGNQSGSNNWVVSPSRSASGAVILASDPHLSLQQPGKWYLAVIRAGSLNVSGVTLAGIPAVVIGKNDSIAWGLTNVMADDADFYSVQFTQDRKGYLIDGDTAAVEIIDEMIKVKDQEPQPFRIYITEFGPVVSAVHPHNTDSAETNYLREIAMKWTGNGLSDEYYAAYKVNKARSLEEFREAVSHFKVPGQNFVYGDKSGNIAYYSGAGIPERGEGDPRMILDGTSSKTKWRGYIPFQMLPSAVNPSKGFIATANNRTQITPFYISSLWEPSSRIERINLLLSEKEKHSAEDFMRYQYDRISFYAEKVTPYLLSAFKEVKVEDPNLKESLELLDAWDYSFEPLSQIPALYSVFLYKFYENTLKDELGTDLLNQYSRIANVPLKIMFQLITNPEAAVFDDITTPKIEKRDEILRKSLSDALNYLENRFGSNLAAWQWGELHTLTLRHFFSGNNALLDRFINDGPHPLGGDGTTLNLSEYPFYRYDSFGEAKEFENLVGPSMRFICDFSQPDNFYYATTGGQSGNSMSDHYKNLTAVWLEGKYIQVKTDKDSFSKNKKVLRLIPE